MVNKYHKAENDNIDKIKVPPIEDRSLKSASIRRLEHLNQNEDAYVKDTPIDTD